VNFTEGLTSEEDDQERTRGKRAAEYIRHRLQSVWLAGYRASFRNGSRK